MDKLKKVFSPGHSKDDEVMYGKPTEAPAGEQSTSNQQPPLVTDPEAEKKSHGVLRQIFNPSGNKYSEEAYGTTAREDTGTKRTSLTVQEDASILSLKSGVVGPYAGGADTPPAGASQTTTTAAATSTSTSRPEDSSQWRDSTLAGIGAAGGGSTIADPSASEGLQRENKGDDVTDSTYTARSYQLSSSVPTEPQGPDRTVEPLNTGDPPPAESSEYVRDGSLAGAGTIIGAGTVSASALAAQQNKPQDAEIANATYTARAYPVGGTDPATVDFHDPAKLDTAARLGPHIPGEFPTETGEDPHHIPGAFPETPLEQADRDLGSGTGVATGIGAGAATGGILGAAALSSPEQPSTTESTAHLGGDGFPIMTPTNSIPHAASAVSATQPESESHYGRDAAIGGSAAAAPGAAGYGIYEAIKGDNSNNQTVQDHVDPQDGITQPTQTEPKPVAEQEPDHHYGRDAAIAGGATAATGAAGYGIYEATKGNEFEKMPQDQALARDPAVSQSQSTVPPASAEARQVGTEPDHSYGRDAAIAGGATAATGAAGYGIYEATKDDNLKNHATQGQAPSQSTIIEPKHPKEVKNKSEKVEPVKTEKAKATKLEKKDKFAPEPSESRPTEPQPEETISGRDAAIVGGTGVAAGAAGYGVYEATNDDPNDNGTPSKASRDREDSTPTETSRGSHDSPNNKTSVDSRGHTHLHKKSVEQQGEKKHGLVSRMLHPNRTKREKEEREVTRQSLEHPEGFEAAHQNSEHIETDGAIGDSHHVSGVEDSNPGDGYDAAYQKSEHVGTDGAIGDSHHVSGLDASKSQPTSSSVTGPSATSAGEQEMITVHHEGADANAPHLIVRDQ